LEAFLNPLNRHAVEPAVRCPNLPALHLASFAVMCFYGSFSKASLLQTCLQHHQTRSVRT
jgi:hypothetical protein